MLELAYSFHIGNDKNKTKKAKQKNTPTNYNNNAIQNAMQLSKVNHHNLRQYDNNPEKIKTLYGSNDIVKDVKEIYKQEFEARSIPTPASRGTPAAHSRSRSLQHCACMFLRMISPATGRRSRIAARQRCTSSRCRLAR